MVPDLSSLPIIDPSLRDELEAVGGAALHPRLVKLFITETEAAWEQVSAAMQAGEADQLARSAHRIKGGAAAIGAKRIATVASALEASGKQNRLEDAAPLRTLLATELEALKSI